MKTHSLIFTAASLLVSSAAFGQSFSATGNGTASAEIYINFALTNPVALTFGDVIPSPSGGTVLVTPGGTVTPSGVALGTNPAHAPAAARFHVAGRNSAGFTISASASDGVMTDGAGGHSMHVTGLTASAASGTLDGSGAADFYLGGTLNVGANQAQGSYSTANAGGTPIQVTVAYN